MTISQDWRSRAAQLPARFASPIAIGTLHVPTGRLLAGEPLTSLDLVPLDRIAPIGDFSVEMALHQVAPGEEAIAALRITFADRPVARWEVATGASNAKLGPAGTPGYTGPIGMFMDLAAASAFRAYADATEEVTWWDGVARTTGRLWEYACVQFAANSPDNCTCVAHVISDDPFVSYWGLDALGAPVVLATDFNIGT